MLPIFCALIFQDFTHGILRAKHGKEEKGAKRLKYMTYMKLKQLAKFTQKAGGKVNVVVFSQDFTTYNKRFNVF